MKRISIIAPCYNEEDNVRELYDRIKSVMDGLNYDYELILIDNASSDRTVEILREITTRDKRLKVIVNTRNFGQIRSPYHAFFQISGDAVVCMAADLQDPPERIPEFVKKWEEGYKIVIGVKTRSEETWLFYFLRTIYYRVARILSDVSLIENFTGFGMYDRQVVEDLRKLNDPYPYFRGLIADLGYKRAEVEFTQPRRKRGISKNNFYTLYDIAMLGLTNYTKVPLRLAAMFGFLSSFLSFVVGLVYLIYKLLFWFQFSLGSAPLVIGLFFLGSVQLMFLGVVGEYIGAIYTQIMHRPLVYEKERINF
jgi:glycosyltransferase involved in cell wall biosynthesis